MVRSCLSLRTHLHMSGCTSHSVCARCVCTPPVSVCRALHARAPRPAGGLGSALGSTRPPGLTPAPLTSRAGPRATAIGCSIPLSRHPSPAPPPARPRSLLSPAVSARPRRAALRSHWLRAPLCGGSCGPSAFECREGPEREPFHGPSVSPPAAAPPPPAPRAPPPAPAAPAAPPPPAPAPRSRATKGPRAAAAAAAARGARMVLVHVGYLVLPVFGSVRNRGIAFSFRGPLRSVDCRRHRGGGGRCGRRGAQGTPAGTQGEQSLLPFLFWGGTPECGGGRTRRSFCSEFRVWRIPSPIFLFFAADAVPPNHSPLP